VEKKVGDYFFPQLLALYCTYLSPEKSTTFMCLSFKKLQKYLLKISSKLKIVAEAVSLYEVDSTVVLTVPIYYRKHMSCRDH
jgi:hypothetical protein